MRVLVVDNLDSFTGSLVQQLLVLGAEPTVARHELPADPGSYSLIVLSPGPGRPEDHSATTAALRGAPLPTFGVCLGMQAIALRFGGRVVPARAIVHGRTSRIYHRGTSFFSGIPSPFRATRYHSLAVTDLPAELEVLAATSEGEIMALRHRTLPVWGVQFHPESVRTQHGLDLVRNVVHEARAFWAPNARQPEPGPQAQPPFSPEPPPTSSGARLDRAPGPPGPGGR